MPLLPYDAPLPQRPRRVLVAGGSGAGKTTLARRVGALLDVPHVEMDGLHHGPHWTPRPRFRADVEALAATEDWVTEWQYSEVRPLLADRSDLVVWLDLPRHRVMAQVTARTVRRRVTRQELWNGNREGPLWLVVRDPEHIIRWAWSSFPRSRERAAGLVESHPALPVVRLTSHREADQWLSGPLAAALTAAS